MFRFSHLCLEYTTQVWTLNTDNHLLIYSPSTHISLASSQLLSGHELISDSMVHSSCGPPKPIRGPLSMPKQPYQHPSLSHPVSALAVPSLDCKHSGKHLDSFTDPVGLTFILPKFGSFLTTVPKATFLSSVPLMCPPHSQFYYYKLSTQNS